MNTTKNGIHVHGLQVRPECYKSFLGEGTNGRKRLVMTQRLTQTVADKIMRTPALSVSTVAREYGMSRNTLGRIKKKTLVKDPLNLTLATAKDKRVTRYKKLLERLLENPDIVVVQGRTVSNDEQV